MVNHNVDTKQDLSRTPNAGLQYLISGMKQNLNVFQNPISKFIPIIIVDSLNHKLEIRNANVDESTVTNVNRSNFKLKAIYDVKLDSVNSLKITANSEIL